MAKSRQIWTLPVLSQEFSEGPVVIHGSTGLRLRYDYETATGEYAWQEALFSGVEAFRFTGHESCDEEQISAYDKLVEVTASPWVAELRKVRRSALSPVRHMRIYFDEVGCYEVVASEFTPPAPPVD